MPSRIAEYYSNELNTWNKQILKYQREMFEFETRLAEVIHRNTIPGIAEKVEERQAKLNNVSIRFFKLIDQLEKQKVSLKKNSSFIDDAGVDSEIEKRQNTLRKFMQQSEKKYIDIKHDCSNFISDTLKKRK